MMKTLRDTDTVARDANRRFGIPVEFSEFVMDDTLRWAQSNPSLPRKFDPGTTVYRVSEDARFSASNRLMQYEVAMAVGDHDTALVHIRRAVKLQPENAMYHFLLGATLGQVGKVDEGIQECWIADALNPDDELPKVEVGIILMNADRNPEARQHLEDMARDRDQMSAHLAFNLGVARFRCEAYPEAMQALDTSISSATTMVSRWIWPRSAPLRLVKRRRSGTWRSGPNDTGTPRHTTTGGQGCTGRRSEHRQAVLPALLPH